MKRQSLYFILILSLFCLDQLTKSIVASSIRINSSVRVIPGFFNITHIQNKGAIFGFFSQAENPAVHILLAIASVAAFGFVIYYFLNTPLSEKLLKFSLTLILTGALGNLSDRIIRGYVIDFLDFYIKGSHWPNFNLADSCITVGAIFLCYIFFFKGSKKCCQSS